MEISTLFEGLLIGLLGLPYYLLNNHLMSINGDIFTVWSDKGAKCK
jgi:hypothetical protein